MTLLQVLSEKVWASPRWSAGLPVSINVKSAAGRAVMDEWAAFVRPLIVGAPRRLLTALCASLGARRDALIAANGGPLKY